MTAADIRALAANPSQVLYEPIDEAPWPDEPAIGARVREPVAVPGGLPVLTWTDLLATPPEPPPMLLEDVPVPKVGVTVIAGPPKIGKSLYAGQIALRAGRCSFVIEEGTRDGISYRLRHQAAGLGIAVPDLEIIHRQGIKLDNRQSVARLRTHVERRRPVALFLDPLNRLHGGDENRPSQMTPVMDALAGLAYDFGIAVVCIHHLAKPSMERRGDIWDRFRGASSIRSGTDANLVLDGSGAMVKIVGEYRDAEPFSDYLELDRDALLFRQGDSPKLAGKVDVDELHAFVVERGRVTVADVAARFGVVKRTARTTLETRQDLDSFDGPRGTRYYTLATG